ncbi:MAG: GNAT family N-acetyltransferase [Verrucomicrobiota bacterium]
MSPLLKTAAIELLAPAHADAIQALVSDPAIAATTRIPHPYPENGARDFIAAHLKERTEGSAYGFVIKDRDEVVGACGLHRIEGVKALELGYWVGRRFWGNGYATFAVGMLLDFAFRNLRLEEVTAHVLESNPASRRVLEKNGFHLQSVGPHEDPLLKQPDELQAIYQITRRQWHDFRNGPAMAALHPGLRQLLEAELAAGNEIVETGRGWPDPDSVFVRLRSPFRPRSGFLPDGVSYLELNDPHWWKAEYHSLRPRHILAY